VSEGPRTFYVGETVHLQVRVATPDTKGPVDPDSVALTSIRRDDEPVEVDPTEFEAVAVGDYALVIATDELEAGTYRFVTTVAGEAGIVLLTDTFVLAALP